MIIKNKAGATLATVTPSDQSTRTRTITGQNTVTLIFSLTGFVDFPAGSCITFEGSTYTTRKPGAFVKNAARSYQYTLTLESEAASLAKYKIRDITTGRLKFSLTATPAEFAAVIVANLNDREPGWTVGECITSTEKSVTFNHTTLAEAVAAIAEAFKTEWEVVGKTISLRKVEYYKEAPQALSYGFGNGFKTGIKRENFDSAQPIEKLLVQGGDRNIDKSTYLASELLLPRNETYFFDGTYFEDETGFQGSGSTGYTSDGDGLAITLVSNPDQTSEEASLDLSDIYPSIEAAGTDVGKITNVIQVDAEKNFWDIYDTHIPADLDFDACLIAGETMSIIFQDGMLAGKEFDCNYQHSTRRLQIIPQEIDGETMPNAIFAPVIGNHYSIFGISLPEAYVCNSMAKTGASWSMFREAIRYFHENKNPRFTFTGALDQEWLATNYVAIGPKLIPGGYIAFSDTQFQAYPVLIRIATVTDNINNKAKATLDLSNVNVATGLVKNQLVKINTSQVVAATDTQKATRYFKRRFRDAAETTAALQQSLLEFSGAINPIAVNTMQLIAGDKSLQLRFVNSKTTPAEVAHEFPYNPATKTLSTAAGIIQHMTFGITALSTTRTVSDYRFWDMAAYSEAIEDETVGLYIYARCAADPANPSGTFIKRTTPIAINGEANYYHFLIGYLNSQSEGTRSWARLYGFTEILPGQITVDRLTSSDGNSFFDTLNQTLKLGTALQYNVNGSGQLIIKGAITQSAGGTTAPITINRGTYNIAYTYYPGDLVTYLGSTYICNTQTTAGTLPTNASYFGVWASKGTDGTSVKIIGSTSTSTDLPPAWSSVIYYEENDCVINGGVMYVFIGGFNWPEPPDSEFWAPAMNIVAGDGWMVQDTGHLWVWDGAIWTDAGQVKGDPGDPGAQGANAAQILLTNDNKAIRCDSTGAAKTSELPCTISAFFYSGGAQVDPTVYQIVGSAGLTYTYTDNGTSLDFNITGITQPTAYIDLVATIPVSGTESVEIPKRIVIYKVLDGANGTNGDNGTNGPLTVNRGAWQPNAAYYGTTGRLDCVKQAGAWYQAKQTAGAPFSDAAWNGARWDLFGGSFESIATGTILANGANLAGFVFVQTGATEGEGMIISQSGFIGTTESQDITAEGFVPKIKIDAANQLIEICSVVPRYNSAGGTEYARQTISLSSETGAIESVDTDNNSARITSQGFFANRAGTQALPSSSGIELKAAHVIHGNGNLAATAYGGISAICGIYADSTNSNGNPAPHFGAYVKKLKAVGMYVGMKTISGTSNYQCLPTDFYIHAYNTAAISVILPTNPHTGQVLQIARLNTQNITIRSEYPATVGGKRILRRGEVYDNITIGDHGLVSQLTWDGYYWIISFFGM